MKLDMNMGISLTGEEARGIDEYVFHYLIHAGWFKTREEAEDWAGDVLLEAILTYLEALGIDLSFSDQRERVLVAREAAGHRIILI